MAAPTKTIQSALITLQEIAAATVIIGSELDVSSKFAVQVFIHFGRLATTALTVGVNFRLEGSAKASGDGHWFPLFLVTTDIATAETEAVSGTVAAGQNVITVAATANLAAGDIIYLDNGTVANSEWGRIKSIVANTSVTIEDNLVNAQTSSTIYDQGQIITALVDLGAVKRIRMVVDNSGSGQAIAAEVEAITLDSIG
jgi:hypothetical protein